jgi:hypothetical protein
MGALRKVLAVMAFMLLTSSAVAQLSPGDLSQAHASLEGLSSCTNCHAGDRQQVSRECLNCHARIQNQIETGKGLHSRPEYGPCQNCHVEHQGRDVSLIYWKGGEAAFDHSLTNFRLEGKHGDLTCRQCHAPKHIVDLTAGANEKVDSSRTFLGLTASCTGCHRDEHRGQLGDDCAKCHNPTAWKPAAGFDHAATRFALTGKHQQVLCIKCHQVLTDRPLPDDPDYQKFTVASFAQCGDCHADVHKGKLGASCNSCHGTEGWRQVSTVSFDHSKTRYPLEGKHLSLACGKCHGEGRSKQGLKFGACRDCHSDYHRGEFAHRSSQGNCEECHTVSGFAPARFLIAQHDQTDYPLRGAHLAVPCMACHKPSAVKGAAVPTFVFASTSCLTCHRDPHQGQVDKLVSADGCEHCHSVAGWAQVNYDHSKGDFALEGRHGQVACTKCHTDHSAAADVKAIRFKGIRTECIGCHADIHRGQLASEGSTDCSRCHMPSTWAATKFDHSTSRFKLDGAHRSVPCARCHPAIDDEAGNFTRYKPIETTCASCHGTTIPERSS